MGEWEEDDNNVESQYSSYENSSDVEHTDSATESSTEETENNPADGEPGECHKICGTVAGVIFALVGLAITIWAAHEGLLFNGEPKVDPASMCVFLLECIALICLAISLVLLLWRLVPLRYLIISLPLSMGVIAVLAALRTRDLGWDKTIVYMGLCFFIIKLAADSIVDLLKVRETHAKQEKNERKQAEGIGAEFHVSGGIAAPSSSNVEVSLTGKIDSQTGFAGTHAVTSHSSSANNSTTKPASGIALDGVGANNAVTSDANSAAGVTHVHMSNAVNDHDLKSAVDSKALGTEDVSSVSASSRIGTDIPQILPIDGNGTGSSSKKFADGNSLLRKLTTLTADDVDKAVSVGLRLAVACFLLVMVTNYPEVATDVAAGLESIFKG